MHVVRVLQNPTDPEVLHASGLIPGQAYARTASTRG